MNNRLSRFKFIYILILASGVLVGCESNSMNSNTEVSSEESEISSEISSEEIEKEIKQEQELLENKSTEVEFEFVEQDDLSITLKAIGISGQTISISYKPNTTIAGNELEEKEDSFVLDNLGNYQINIPIGYLNIDGDYNVDLTEVTISSKDSTEEDSKEIDVYVSSEVYEKYILESGKLSFENYPPSEFAEILEYNNQYYKWAYTFMTTFIKGYTSSYVEEKVGESNRYHIQAFYYMRHNSDSGIDYGSKKLDFFIPINGREFNFPLSGTDPFSSAYYTSQERDDVIDFSDTIETSNTQVREMGLLITNQH